MIELPMSKYRWALLMLLSGAAAGLHCWLSCPLLYMQSGARQASTLNSVLCSQHVRCLHPASWLLRATCTHLHWHWLPPEQL